MKNIIITVEHDGEGTTMFITGYDRTLRRDVTQVVRMTKKESDKLKKAMER